MSSSLERKFLHDIASPIGSALFIVDSLVELLTEAAGDQSLIVEAKDLSVKALDSLERTKKMIEARRELLMNQEGQAKQEKN